MKKQKKIIKEVFKSEEIQNSMREFLIKVLETMDQILQEHEIFVIESAFAAYGIYVKEDFINLSEMNLQNLFNSIDSKLKMLNARRFYYSSDGNKINKLTDLI